MITLWVDFNEVFDDDYVWTSVRRTPSLEADLLSTGDWVELNDDDGATCWGLVVERNGPIVTCKLDWSHWREISVQLDEPAFSGANRAALQPGRPA